MILFIAILCVLYFAYLYFKEVYPLRDMSDEEFDHHYGEGASATRPSVRTLMKRIIEVGAIGAAAVSLHTWVLPLIQDIKPDAIHPVAFTTVPPF